MSDPVATLTPSPIRRVLAVFVLGGTGALLLSLALLRPPGSGLWLVYLLALGGGMIWVTYRLWQATEAQVILTDEGLFTSEGTCLARIDDIASVERGVFAFKPSNGFTVRLRQRAPRGWAPGLWWRFGRNLGIGGVTPAAEGKYMSEMLAMALHDVTQDS